MLKRNSEDISKVGSIIFEESCRAASLIKREWRWHRLRSPDDRWWSHHLRRHHRRPNTQATCTCAADRPNDSTGSVLRSVAQRYASLQWLIWPRHAHRRGGFCGHVL